MSYDQSSAGGGASYGDPWQLVYVFDGDPSTNVVCEGYAKAFQYLCDLTRFDGDVTCRTVSGTMNGGAVRRPLCLGRPLGVHHGVAAPPVGLGHLDGDGEAGAAGTEGGRTHTAGKTVYTYGPEQENLFGDGWTARPPPGRRPPPAARR